jgi:hypothetical protein
MPNVWRAERSARCQSRGQSVRQRVGGVCVGAIQSWGNILTDKDSPHYKAHQVLETFWVKNRSPKPKNSDYAVALKKSLEAADFSASEVR